MTMDDIEQGITRCATCGKEISETELWDRYDDGDLPEPVYHEKCEQPAMSNDSSNEQGNAVGQAFQVGDRVRFWCYCGMAHECSGVVVDINGAGHYGIDLGGGNYVVRPPSEVQLILRATPAPAATAGAMDTHSEPETALWKFYRVPDARRRALAQRNQKERDHA